MTQSGRDTFISKWMSLLRPACSEVLEAERWSNPAELRQALEQASIRHSLENLKTFPFIRERLDAGELRLHGAYFDIASGRLQALDAATATFEVVE